MKDLDFSREHMDTMMKDYEPLLCTPCKESLRVAAEPIRDRLNEGKSPKMRHMKKLLRALCPACTVMVAQKNQEGKR